MPSPSLKPSPQFLRAWLFLCGCGTAFCLALWAVLVGLALRAYLAGDRELAHPSAGFLLPAIGYPVFAFGATLLARRLARNGWRAWPALVALLPLVPVLGYLVWMSWLSD